MTTSVKYELIDIEGLLSAIQEGTSNTTEVEPKIVLEMERIKKALVNEVFSFEDERHLERYIQYHQQAAIRLLDSYVSSSKGATLRDPIYKGLEHLLAFIERHFTKYFDQDAKAPEGYLNTIRKITRTVSKRIFRELAEQGADLRLLEVLLQIISKINDKSSASVPTYRKLMYAKEVQKELLKMADNHPGPAEINEELIKLIYYLNYNSTKALTYHAHLVNQIVTTSETRAEKIERLSLLLKQVNQAQVKPGIAYNPRAASIKDQLNNYINEEIEYLDRVEFLNSVVPTRKENIGLSSFKVKLELSVSQLSYLIKIFIATALIQNSNTTELLKFFSKIIVTKKSELISYDSLRAKFYNVESSTRASVRELLSLLILHVDKDH